MGRRSRPTTGMADEDAAGPASRRVGWDGRAAARRDPYRQSTTATSTPDQRGRRANGPNASGGHRSRQEDAPLVEVDGPRQRQRLAHRRQLQEDREVEDEQLHQQRRVAEQLHVARRDAVDQPVAGQPGDAQQHAQHGREARCPATGHQERVQRGPPAAPGRRCPWAEYGMTASPISKPAVVSQVVQLEGEAALGHGAQRGWSPGSATATATASTTTAWSSEAPSIRASRHGGTRAGIGRQRRGPRSPARPPRWSGRDPAPGRARMPARRRSRQRYGGA